MSDNNNDKTNNNPSDELLTLVDQYINLEGSRVDLVRQIVDKCKEDNVEPNVIRKIIEIKLKSRGLSDRTIYRALPDEFKDKKMQQVRAHRLEYVRKEDKIPDRVEQIQTPEEYAYGHEDTAMINKDTDTQQDTPVYREPDRIEPKPEWIPTTKPELEQSYHTMNVPVPIPDYTVTTQLQIYNGTGNNIGQFTVDVVAKCYPSKKTVVLEPIDKATIKKVVA